MHNRKRIAMEFAEHVNNDCIEKIILFGSVARGEQTEGSDVDIYYEGEVPSLLTLDLIQTDLEKLLDSKIDLIRIRKGMNSLLRKRIKKEGIHV